MATTLRASQNFVQMPRTAREPRVAAAVKAVSMESFPPLSAESRDMAVEAIVRMLEDLQVVETARVLLVEPFSGYLPELLGRLAAEVVVVCTGAGGAMRLRAQLADAGAANVQVETFVHDRADGDEGFDRILVMQPANEELGPVLHGLLRAGGRAVWSVDKAIPPRRVRRLLRIDDDVTVEEDLDLVHFMPLLGDMLVDAGVALRQEVSEAVVAVRSNGRLLGEELLDRGSVRERDLYEILADQQGRSFVTAGDVLTRVDIDLVKQLPRTYLDYHRFVPVCTKNGKVWIVTPDIHLPIAEVQSVFEDVDVVCELVCPRDLDRIWAVLDLGLSGLGTQRLQAQSTLHQAEVVASEHASPVGNELSTPKLCDVLAHASARRATHVHLQERGDAVWVRYRIDGCLHEESAAVWQTQDLVGLIASLGSTGTSCCTIDGQRVVVRHVVHEATTGRSLVLHLAEQSPDLPQIEELGFSAETQAGYREALDQARGLVVVAGPNESGRSTTMRAAFDHVARDVGRKVVASDEVSAQVAGDSREADVIRQLAQLDANVLCIDVPGGRESCHEILRAAHRGHVVVATLSGNDVADAVQGLFDFGLTGNAVAANVNAVLVQHLARRNCSGCRQEVEPSAQQLAMAFPSGVPAGLLCIAGQGCEHCHGTGHDGRVPVVEFLSIRPALRRALRSGVAPHDLGSIARQDGLLSLRDSALALLLDGVISLAEFCRVLTDEQREGVAGQVTRAGKCS